MLLVGEGREVPEGPIEEGTALNLEKELGVRAWKALHTRLESKTSKTFVQRFAMLFVLCH